MLTTTIIKELGKFYSGQTSKINLSNKTIKDLEHNIYRNYNRPDLFNFDAILDYHINFFVGIVSSTIKKEDIIEYLVESGLNIRLKDLLVFNDLRLLLTNNNAIKTVKFIINNDLKNLTFKGRKVSFKDLEEVFSHLYFEDFHDELSIEGGSALVKLCDYLKIKVKPLGNSPKSWDLEEYTFAEYKGSKQDLINFSRLFKDPIKEWYPHWSHKYA